MKPLYTHDCDKCLFLGTWRKNPDCDNQQDFDLYVCEALTNLPSTNCVARYGSDGPDYASMTLGNGVWDESLAAYVCGEDRPSMHHCWMPELLECWRRWKDKQWKAAYLDHFSVRALPDLGGPCTHPSRGGKHELYGSVDGLFCRACGAGKKEVEEKEKMHTSHPNPDLPTPTDAQLEQMKVYRSRVLAKSTPYSPDVPQWGTHTGRIQSAEPSMANIPVGSEEGARIRSKFSPNFPMQSVESDAVSRYTQALRNGSDLHKMMAAAVFGKAGGEVTPEEREEIKDANFFAAYAIHDQVEFKTATRQEPNTPASGIGLHLLTADGYTFKVHADGSIGDGDLSWPSLQTFIDSYKKGE